MRRFSFFALGALLVAAGCSKSPTINIPPPPPARMFVANFLTATVTAMTQPLSATSTVSTTIHTALATGWRCDRPRGQPHRAERKHFLCLRAAR